MKIVKYILFLVVTTTLISCATSKSYTKKGQKLEESGMTVEAANNYKIALQKNRSNVAAQIGMKGTGQAVLTNKLQQFAQESSFNNKKVAIAKYHEARDYYNTIKALGVELVIPDFYRSDYENVKNEYLDELYSSGIEHLDNQDYNKAELVFKEIHQLDPNFQDAEDLMDLSYVEPIYQEGLTSLDNEMFRSAHSAFQRVMKRTPDYKDASDLKKQCVEEGLFTMALLPFENSTGRRGLDSKISAYALEALTNVDDPFLKVVDREHMALIIEEQQLGLTGVIDEETAVSVGELIGAQAIITGTVLSYSEKKENANTSNRIGYEQYRVKKYNKEDDKYYYDTKYRKTDYKVTNQESYAKVSFQFKIISLATGEIIRSKIIDREIRDEVKFATYGAEINNLYPAKSDGVNLNKNAKRELNSLFSSRKTLRPLNELANDVLIDVSNEMQGEVEILMKQIVQ